MSGAAQTMRKLQRGFCSAVVLAAGESQRMGEDKLFLPLDGIPVLGMGLCVLQSCPDIDEILVVTREEALKSVEELRSRFGLRKVKKLVLGGDTRTASALAGVNAVSRRAKIICIHDGARPFLTSELVEEVVRAAVLYQAAAPAVPVKDTIKRAKQDVVLETPDRDTLFAVQTPQAFHAELIKGALTQAVKDGKTYPDDCAAAEAFGVRVRLTTGMEENLKITTPLDMALAQAICARRKAGT